MIGQLGPSCAGAADLDYIEEDERSTVISINIELT